MTSNYNLNVQLAVDYDQALKLIVEALKEEGFGVLTEIDVKSTLKQKLNVDFKRYAILGACNPQLAHQALQVTDDVGLLLPCNVIVYEYSPQATTVSITDPATLLKVTGSDDLDAIGAEASERLQRVRQKLSTLA